MCGCASSKTATFSEMPGRGSSRQKLLWLILRKACQPLHFQWVTGGNVPEDPDLCGQELLKYGDVKHFYFLHVHNEVRYV
ncbi:hypothetical protein RvY_00607 [Ramazzottius varieornatus]|uniref:Uncharacterized protein n=1 Tax=Ramazzottius varieornatus TaxID=947166 RepID=A0A1D1UDD4_RAMVA|nr:hypothetical protein RvY_00607 [Ramazzottius varieornatus]